VHKNLIAGQTDNENILKHSPHIPKIFLKESSRFLFPLFFVAPHTNG